MSKDQGFRTIQELIAALSNTERGLAGGSLDLQGLETACNDARELFERLVVLRHKAREAALAAPRPASEPAPAAPAPPAPAAVETPSLRLDTRPPAASPRQVSLIEAIEESTAPEADQAPPDLAPAKAPEPTASVAGSSIPQSTPKGPVTLAEKLERSSIQDLSKAISLSHKFWFVAELFGGDRIAYDRTIGLLNALGDQQKAVTFMETEVLSKLKKPADPEALATFMDLLQRRYA